MTRTLRGRQQQGAQGFTLIEALIAVVVLVFGLIAVAQLMAVAAGSNAIANRTTVASAVASEELERLMTVPYGSLGTNPGGDLNLEDTAPGVPPPCISSDFGSIRDVSGMAQIRTCWRIESAGGAGNLLAIRVRSQAVGPFSHLTQAEFTSFRATNGVAPTPTSAPTPGGP
jgi:hypothetical protein